MTTTTSKAAAILGRKGGKAGRGASQRRSPEHYRAAAQESATVRRALKAIRKRIVDGVTVTGWYDLAGLPAGESAMGPPSAAAEIHVTLARAGDGGPLFGIYVWARVGLRDLDQLRYRRL